MVTKPCIQEPLMAKAVILGRYVRNRQVHYQIIYAVLNIYTLKSSGTLYRNADQNETALIQHSAIMSFAIWMTLYRNKEESTSKWT
jgi:hypothetical protein